MIRILVYILVLPLFLVPLGAALWQVFTAPGGSFAGLIFSPGILAALRFSLSQALLSSLLALILGIPGAWLMARTSFRGKTIFRIVSSIPFVFPPVLFVLGFIGVWGNNGFINSFISLLPWSSGEPLNLAYSFWAIILAHGLFNFPLVIVMLAPLWRTQPQDLEDAARLLGAGPFRAWLSTGLPSVVPGLGAAASLVFLYCFMSFTIPLLLGGGPRFATLEVSIFVALNSGGGLAKAGVLALIECTLAGAVLGMYQYFSRSGLEESTGINREPIPLADMSPVSRFMAKTWLLLSTGLALSPVLSLLVSSLQVQGRPGTAAAWSLDNYVKLAMNQEFFRALMNAAMLALLSGMLACFIAILLVNLEKADLRQSVKKFVLTLPLAISPVFLALGYLILFPGGTGIGSLVLVQATVAYPLAYRALSASRSQWSPSLHHAASLLGASRLQQFFSLDLPLLKNALFGALALTMALSLGDVNGPIMLNIANFPLPGLQAYQLMGSYQYGQASALGVLICLLAAMAFWGLQERGEKERDHVLYGG